MKRKLGTLTLLFFLLTFLTTGCWDSREVEELAIITLVGWDRITEEGIDKWQVSARIMHPVTKGGQENEGTKKNLGSEILVKGTGETIQAAFQDFVRRIPRSAFYSHTTALIIGERAAQEKLPELTEASLRYPETRPHAYILVTKGEAFDELQTEPEMASLLSKEVKRLARESAQMDGVSYGTTITEFSEWLISPDRDALLSQIQVYYPEKGEESVPKTNFVQGFGVIREGKLVGWLNEEESLGYLLVAQKTSRAQIAIPVQFEDKMFTYWVSAFKSRIIPQTEGDKISYLIKINVIGGVFENDGIEVTPESIPSLEEASGEKTREIALKTIQKAQEYDADFLGLTEQLHRYKPSAWQKISDNWRENFRDVEVQVEVNAKITNAGKIVRKLDVK